MRHDQLQKSYLANCFRDCGCVICVFNNQTVQEWLYITMPCWTVIDLTTDRRHDIAESYASATEKAFTSFLTSKLVGFNFVFHFVTLCSTTWASVSCHLLRLFTLLLYDYRLTSDLENLLAMPTHMMNICAKFHSKLCIASGEITQNGRRNNGRTAERPDDPKT